MIVIENAVGEIKSDVSHTVLLNNSTPIICETIKSKGIFFEKLELKDFPVDVQDLSITLKTSRKSSELDFFQNTEFPSRINTKTCKQEWTLYKHIEVSKRISSHDTLHGETESPSISFTCHACRNPG